MRTVTLNLYGFDELSASSQEIAKVSYSEAFNLHPDDIDEINLKAYEYFEIGYIYLTA